MRILFWQSDTICKILCIIFDKFPITVATLLSIYVNIFDSASLHITSLHLIYNLYVWNRHTLSYAKLLSAAFPHQQHNIYIINEYLHVCVSHSLYLSVWFRVKALVLMYKLLRTIDNLLSFYFPWFSRYVNFLLIYWILRTAHLTDSSKWYNHFYKVWLVFFFKFCFCLYWRTLN